MENKATDGEQIHIEGKGNSYRWRLYKTKTKKQNKNNTLHCVSLHVASY
jgi:hypothetical protein